MAGYKHPNTLGPRLKRELQTEIDARLAKMAMSANEVLERLGDIARADVSDFITETGAIDWEKVRKKGYLIKRIIHHKGRQSTIELHDAQSALQHLDRYHGGDKGQAIEQRLVIEMRGNVGPDDL